MSDDIAQIDPRHLKSQMHDGDEIAVLDAREEGIFARRHLLMAACAPLSRLEVLIDDLVPRRSARVVWCDADDGSASRAARRMRALGYADVAVLQGGVAGWEAAGYRTYSGVHVPSKAFAEIVEHRAGTPWISAPDLQKLMEGGADIAIFDSRSYEEYHDNSIPGAVSVPGAELVYRFADLVPSPATTVIVNCGGRTRSIIGAQSLIDAGFENRIVSLKDGTMAWHLAGLDVVQGAGRRPPAISGEGLERARAAAARIAARLNIRRIDRETLAEWRAEADRRSLYVIDVRTPEEYVTGHLRDARSVPGGQLVQETDSHVATWGGRIVLVDDTGVRATMTASWLKRMGWDDVAVLAVGSAEGDRVPGPYTPRVLGLDAAAPATVEPNDLRAGTGAGTMLTIDLATSRHYRQGHIPGAWFAIRSQLAEALPSLPPAETIVLTSPDGSLARLAAADLAATSSLPVKALSGGTHAWRRAGFPLETGATHMACEADDVALSARERGRDRDAAMREYLAWEIDLVNQMATDDDQRFQIATE